MLGQTDLDMCEDTQSSSLFYQFQEENPRKIVLFHLSSLLTTDSLPPATDMDPCSCTGMDIRRDCSTHAVLTFLTVTAVIHAVL